MSFLISGHTAALRTTPYEALTLFYAVTSRLLLLSILNVICLTIASQVFMMIIISLTLCASVCTDNSDPKNTAQPYGPEGTFDILNMQKRSVRLSMITFISIYFFSELLVAPVALMAPSVTSQHIISLISHHKAIFRMKC